MRNGLLHDQARGAQAQHRRAARGVSVAAAGALAISGAVFAVDEIEFTVEHIQGAGWSARDVSTKLSLEDSGAGAQLQIAQLALPGLERPLTDVQIQCPKLDISSEAYACRSAAVRLSQVDIGAQSLLADVRYGRADGALDVKLTDVRLGKGTGGATLSARADAWTTTLSLKDAPVDVLLNLAMKLGFFEAPVSADAGAATMSASVHGAGANVQRIHIDAQFGGVTLNNDSGSLATDKLFLKFTGVAERKGRGWRFAVEASSRQGQAYAQPIFLDSGVHGLRVAANGISEEGGRFTLERFSIDHSDVAMAHGGASIDLDAEQPLRSLDLNLTALHFPGAYESYLQPLLLDTNFKSMRTTGSLGGRIRIEDGAPHSVDLAFHGVSFDDGADVFALANLRGRWQWIAAQHSDDEDVAIPTASGEAFSRLHWDSGLLLGLSLGASDLRFSTEGRQFRLLAPARIPVLDGAIDFETFRVRSAGTPKAAFLVDAAIQPISVQLLCKAFGWPEFGGRIAGAVSKLRMRDGVITLGATLQAQVFDGEVSISDLRLEQPFGQWPRFHSSIALDDLDLELLTSAFSFGRITGRLSGAVQNLRLFNWTPIAFDARLYTPPNDRSRHRISQRAVQNIGNIGGGGAGVTAALSSGFLRFFEDFNYDRLGLSCRLENEVCRMGGVAPAPNGGYYLVKGRGIPRIDVIGNAQRVDWPRLVQQLIALTESEGPVVQ